jgi:hypothetical protein
MEIEKHTTGVAAVAGEGRLNALVTCLLGGSGARSRGRAFPSSLYGDRLFVCMAFVDVSGKEIAGDEKW